mmetsp:Transcript_31160/g.101587  ORF Transcript_31160/g.101587 Transcript_31160/m.101587 type:complete len:154 (-) Transcript_31160:40-501(-)
MRALSAHRLALSSSSSRSALRQRRVRGRTASRAARAAADDEELTFDTNKNAALGFTEEDSAGQSNIFAVEPKMVVAGSSADSGDTGSPLASVVAFLVAGGAVGAGFLALSGQEAAPEKVVADGLPLSYYVKMFEAPAPAPVVVEAPPVSIDDQ